jgi:hypothetical protein
MKTNTSEKPEALRSTAVMQRLAFKDRKSFWEFVHREGVPHCRLSARNIVFFPDALDAWLAKRSTGGTQ